MFYIGNSIIRNGAIAPLSEQTETGVDGEIYEMFRVENGRPVFLPDHLSRYAASIRSAGRPLPDCFDRLPSLIEWLTICNQLLNNEIRLCLSPDGLFQGGFVTSVYPTPQMYAEGVHCVLLHDTRQMPNAKIYHAEMRQNAHNQQLEADAYESILVNGEGKITEGSRSNIFFVSGHTLVTAPDSLVLKGIMRQKVLEVAARKGIDVKFEAVDQNAVNKYDAAFISSTPARILPIKSITTCNYCRNNDIIASISQGVAELISK